MKFRFFFIIIVLSVFSCARRGNPSGGPKDESEPILIRTIPEFKSTHFDKKEIKIYFDEYVKLKDLQKKLVISPPLKYPPIITPQGSPSKKLTIVIKDTLLENTTYTFNFGESIVDNSEGNILSNFKYIFSTGSYIDSLSVSGIITDAISRRKSEGVSVFLYPTNKQFNDSTIYKEKPLYVANVLDSVNWKIDNIKQGKYHLIAIKDDNKDFLFSPKRDKIGFLDSIISIPTEKEFKIKLFKEVLNFKSFRPIEVSKGHIVIGFQGKPDNFKATVDIHKSGIEHITNVSFFEKEKDTLNYYFTTEKDIDSLVFNISNKEDILTKTVRLRAKKQDSLKINNNLRGVLHLGDTLKLITNNPLSKFNKKLFSLYDKDTVAVDFTLQQDGYRKLLVLFKKEEEQNYKLTALPNAITDFFSLKNKDTIVYSFRTRKKDNYGSISLKVNNLKGKNIIVQLLSNKEKLIDEKVPAGTNKVDFELLQPAKYVIRIIYDNNQNGIWDSGNFLKKIQPEKILYFGKEIEVKENWYINESIDLK